MLEANDISVGYAGISGLSLMVSSGEILGLVGPSGSGKTTVARVLAGALRPDQGRVLIDGTPWVFAARKRPTQIAIIGQSPRQACNPGWSLREIIAEPCAIRKQRCQVESLAERVMLGPEVLDRTPVQVSDGQLQRACIARAMAQQPRYVICDEPTSALDPIASAGIMTLLRAQADSGVGVLLVSHDHRLVAAQTDRVMCL